MTPVKPMKLTDEVERILKHKAVALDRQAIFKEATLAYTVDDISRTLHQLHMHGRIEKFKQVSGNYLWAAPGIYIEHPAQPAVAKNTGSPRLAKSSKPPAEARAVAATTHRPADTTAPVGSDVGVYELLRRFQTAQEFGDFVSHLARTWARMHAAAS